MPINTDLEFTDLFLLYNISVSCLIMSSHDLLIYFMIASVVDDNLLYYKQRMLALNYSFIQYFLNKDYMSSMGIQE